MRIFPENLAAFEQHFFSSKSGRDFLLTCHLLQLTLTTEATKSTISQKLKVAQEILMNQKIIFRAIRIFYESLATFEQQFLFWLVNFWQIVNTISHNSKDKNRKNLNHDFPFYSSLWVSFM